MKKRMISLCMVMAILITMLPKICLPVSASIPDVWYDFLSTRGFRNYILDSDGVDDAEFQYAVYDLNADGTEELVLQVTRDAPFFFTWVFTLSDGDIVTAYEDYGYGSYRYSPKLNMVIGSSETKPDAYSAYAPFYCLKGTELEFAFTVGQDMGESFYYDGSSTTAISDEERSSYFDDVVWLEFAEVKEVAITESQESGYAKIVAETIEEIRDLGWATGFGTLYDVDGNGVAELLLIHGAKVQVDSEFYGFGAVCSAYTMLDGEVVALLDHKPLYVEAGDPSAYIAVVKKDGETYLAVHKSNAAVEELYYSFGSWELYTVNGTSIELEANVEYEMAEDNNGSIVDDQSFAKIEGKFCEYTAYLEWASGIEELFAIYPIADSGKPQHKIAKTLEELLEYLKAHPVVESESAYGDYLKDLWIRQHMEYANSAEYEQEIIGGYSEWMLATLRESKNDTALNSYEARKYISKILELDFEFSEAEMYELILAELLFGSSGLTLSEQEYAQKLKETTSDVVQVLYTIVDEADDIGGDVKDAIKDTYKLLQTLKFGTEAYGDAFTEFVSMVEKNASDVKKGLAEDGIFLVGDILIDYLFERYDCLEDILIYVSHYMACKTISEQRVGVMQQMLIVCCERDGWAGANPFVEELGLNAAVVNWQDFQTALLSVIGAYQTYKEEGIAAVATYAVEREKKADQKFQANVIKKVSLFSAEKLLSCIPVINAIIVAKNVVGGVVELSLLLDKISTNVEDREFAVDMMVKTYCLSIFLDNVVKKCARLMTEDDFFSTTVFDESISIYKKNQLLASDYMLKYADLTVADMLEQVEELEIRKRQAVSREKEDLQWEIRRIWERLSWYSRHLKDLRAEKAAIEAIACHDSQLLFDSDTNKVIYQFEDSKVYLIACPVDVIIRNEAGEQIAYLSGETNQVPAEYRFYFHTIKMNDGSGEYIKVAVVPDGYQVELVGTGEGTMNAFITDYSGESDAVEAYIAVPVEEGSVGYFESGADEEISLVMDQVTYEALESQEEPAERSGMPGIWFWVGIWLGGCVIGWGVLLVVGMIKKKRR